ncbi:MAG: T9SS type A sorting domain-containing protein [Cytophagaceae bacterium]
MKRTFSCWKTLCVFILFFSKAIYAQQGPFGISPVWHFGFEAGIDFRTLPPQSITGGRTTADLWTIEGSTTACDPSGNLVFYTDGYRLFDRSHNIIAFLNGGTTSTQTAVCFPDPANPTQDYYLFVANTDPGGGGDRIGMPTPSTTYPNGNLGIYWYKIRNTGASISIISGAGGTNKIANNDQVSEQICSGVDPDGNYWVVAHEGGNYGWQNWGILAWKVTAAGVQPAVRSSLSTAVPYVNITTGNNVWHGSLKINKCQSRLAAVYGTGSVEVYNWDDRNGVVTGLVRRLANLPTLDGVSNPSLYGCEFSPDGNILYITSLANNKLYQLDILTGNVYSQANWNSSNNGVGMGTLQLGPDDRIYVTNDSDWGNPVYVGVVENPNVPGAGCNYNRIGFTLKNNAAVFRPNIDKGITNMGWFNPPNPEIIAQCDDNNVVFSYRFVNYFGRAISVDPASVQWDWGDGNGFQSNATLTHSRANMPDGRVVRVRLNESTCGRTYIGTTTVFAACVLPVTWLNISAIHLSGDILVEWQTAIEINNDYFIVQRSYDGEKFEDIGIVKAIGESKNISAYKFVDKEANSDHIYYRIKQIDRDNKSSYSPLATVFSEVSDLKIFPNPFSDEFRIIISGSGNRLMSICDVYGRELISNEVSSGDTFGSTLVPGSYLVKLFMDEKIIVRKIIKSH